MKNKQEVLDWAKNKNLLKKENSLAQFTKVVEEVGEVGRALLKQDKEELIDGLGDVLVTIIILAAQNDLDIEECLDSAYNVIKNRTGKTVNGVFIKN
jgi:NTP pyrophosphatase (non-canonical NTP hydrolase)